MEIELHEYGSGFKEDNRKRQKQGRLSHSVVRQRRYAVDELTDYFQSNGRIVDTEDFYDSTDAFKEFFDQTNLHKSKVAAIRNFLEYIERQLPTREADRVHDIRERIKYSRLTGDTGKSRKAKKKEIEEKILSKRELQQVYFVANLFEELIIRSMLDMGTRPGELAALTASDIDWNYSRGGVGATVKIDKTFSQGVGIQDHPKTEESIRTVNLRRETADLLQKYIDKEEIGESELIFDGYRTVYDSIKEVFTFAGLRIEENSITSFSPHSLRHNTATRLIVEEGYSKEKVQQYLGHSSIETTEIYEHFDEDQVVEIYTESPPTSS